jgi:hypothetical protein
MTIYICNEKFRTVTAVDRLPPDSRLSKYPLGTSLEIGPTWNNIPPPRVIAVTSVGDMPRWARDCDLEMEHLEPEPDVGIVGGWFCCHCDECFSYEDDYDESY